MTAKYNFFPKNPQINGKSLSFFLLFIATIFSCGKVSESMKRDIRISQDTVDFTIPKVTTTESGSNLGKIMITMDFDALIKQQTNDLGAGDAKNFKLTSFRIVLDSLREGNNFGNFENISVYIESDSQPKVLVAKSEANPSSDARSISLPLLPNNPELKEFLSGDSFRFVLTGKARNATTMELKAQASMSYSLSLER